MGPNRNPRWEQKRTEDYLIVSRLLALQKRLATRLDELGKRVRKRVNPPESIDQLQRVLTDEWNNIHQAFVMRLIGSMRRRCLAVSNARGGHTRY
jgi:hypothetical protein